MQNGVLTIAFQRLGRSILGIWCVSGPILLIFSYREFELSLLLFLTALITVFYAIGISKWWHQGIAFIRAVGIDVLLAFLFAAVGNFIEALIAAFGGPQLHRQGA